MKIVPSTLAGALATLYASNASVVLRNFLLTPQALHEFEEALILKCGNSETPTEEDLHLAVAHACLRRKAYHAFDKFSHMAKPEEVEEALNRIHLSNDLQAKLMKLNDDRPVPPKTWKEDLQHLQELSSRQENGQEWLWRKLLNHPMTEYVPVHCPNCGHAVPDAYSPGTSQQQADALVGLAEVDPTGSELALRGGWFRGPRGPIVFQIRCANCRQSYQWYRSAHPQLLLEPNRGRLCGEQEDLRLSLANYLGISVRIALPLDWDHIWTEFQAESHWQVEDDSARNFACRLDEGIGCWTGVLAFHPDPNLCEEISEEYLKGQQEGGRVDHQHLDKLKGYSSRVRQARADGTFQSTQAGTGAGYILHRAGLTSTHVTDILRQAAKDYKDNVPWWECGRAGSLEAKRNPSD